MRAKLSLAIGYDEKDSGYVFDGIVVLPEAFKIINRF